MSGNPIEQAITDRMNREIPRFTEEEKTRLRKWILRQMSKESSIHPGDRR